MGMKRRGRILDLASEFQEAEAAYEAAAAELEQAASVRQEAWQALVDAGPGAMSKVAVKRTPGPASAPSAPRAGRGSRKRMPREFYSNLQDDLYKAMKSGTKYTGPELQDLISANGISDQTFTKRVRMPLIDSGKIKKAWAEKGNTSPVNVRWIRG